MRDGSTRSSSPRGRPEERHELAEVRLGAAHVDAVATGRKVGRVRRPGDRLPRLDGNGLRQRDPPGAPRARASRRVNPRTLLGGASPSPRRRFAQPPAAERLAGERGVPRHRQRARGSGHLPRSRRAARGVRGDAQAVPALGLAAIEQSVGAPEQRRGGLATSRQGATEGHGDAQARGRVLQRTPLDHPAAPLRPATSRASSASVTSARNSAGSPSRRAGASRSAGLRLTDRWRVRSSPTRAAPRAGGTGSPASSRSPGPSRSRAPPGSRCPRPRPRCASRGSRARSSPPASA